VILGDVVALCLFDSWLCGSGSCLIFGGMAAA
jgi:hypothetical protein